MKKFIFIIFTLLLVGMVLFFLTFKHEINESEVRDTILASSYYRNLATNYGDKNVVLTMKELSRDDADVLNKMDDRLKIEKSWMVIIHPHAKLNIEEDVIVHQFRASATLVEGKTLTEIKTSFDSELYLKFYPEEKETIELFRICKKIGDEKTRNACLALLDENPARCEKIGDEKYFLIGKKKYFLIVNKDECYMTLALKTNNVSLCEKISTEPYMDRFHTMRFTCEALVDKSLTKCEEADQKEVYGAYCYLRLAELTKNPAYCERYLKYAESVVLQCKASIEKNPAYCEALAGINQPGCYSVLAMLTEDISFCDKTAFYEGAKEICQAVVRKDISFLNCEERHRACAAIAILTKDDSVCGKIGVAENYRCYYNMALLKSEAIPVETLVSHLGDIWL